MIRTLLLVPALLAAGLLVACGADAVDEGPPTTARPEAGGGTDVGSTTAVSSETAEPGTSGRPLAAGELFLRVDGGRVVLSAATIDPAVVLRDLSLATTTATGSAWDVLVTRPVGARHDPTDLPDTYEGVVAAPGAPVDVGVFELGPRPPTELTLCVEVVAVPADRVDAEAGTTVLLPAGTEGDDPAYLCATTAVG